MLRIFVTLFFLLLSSVGSAVTYDCGLALYSDGHSITDKRIRLEYSGANLLILVSTLQANGVVTEPQEFSTFGVGKQQVGGVFHSNNGAYSVFVDPSEGEGVKLRYRNLNRVAWSVCAISQQQSLPSVVYSVLHLSEIQRLSLPIVQEFSRIAGKRILRSLDDCSNTSTLYTKIPDESLKDQEIQEYEHMICFIYRSFYEGSAFGSSTGIGAITRGYELCDLHLKTVSQALNEKNVTPFKKSILQMNSQICRALISIKSVN